VVVCHHVAYNVPGLSAFAQRLTDHARTRVVMELTARHPQSNLNPLWQRFHGVQRPDKPTADDALDVLKEAGLEPRRDEWTAPRAGGFRRAGDMVAWVRRLLCLPARLDPDVERALREHGLVAERDGQFGLPDRPVVTLWWEGRAGGTAGPSAASDL
jgi:hypothetical protein